MESSTDRRLHERDATEARLEIEWTGFDGVRESRVGRAVDSSTHGLSGVFPGSASIGQIVTVEFPELEIFGVGVIRHSTPVDDGFLVGIALIGDLHDP